MKLSTCLILWYHFFYTNNKVVPDMDKDKKNSNYPSKEERSKSPEKLNEYIRIGSPGGLILVGALFIVAVALIIWGFIGRIPVTVSVYGTVVGN